MNIKDEVVKFVQESAIYIDDIAQSPRCQYFTLFKGQQFWADSPRELVVQIMRRFYPDEPLYEDQAKTACDIW